jgi:predicted nuclease of restriction endonuclease-like (RecB) superfamily
MKDLIPTDYLTLLRDIKERIRSAQYAALKTVNKELITLYWDIGRMIVEQQQGDTWGKSVVEQLAIDLQKEFPGIQGFSARNIWYMRNFYHTYGGNEKLQPMVAEIGWTHNLLILDRCKDDLEREFYIRMTRKFGWTKNVLIHQIENQAYEKTLLGQTNFDQTVPENIRAQAKLAVKDEYTFDFLELGEEHNERELERAIIAKIEKFLREMGGLFAFLGSQYRLEIGDKEYFIDLLLFHRRLKCWWRWNSR